MEKWAERFRNPGNEFRPKIRYWMPHAVMSEEGLRKDVKDIAERGFGSIEAVSMTRGVREGFYQRDVNMWGSDAWVRMMKVLLTEAEKYGMTVDIANGPLWPLVDIKATDPDDENNQYELSYGLKLLESGETYRGVPPQPAEYPGRNGTMKLVAVSLYRLWGPEVLEFDSYQAIEPGDQITVTAPDDGSQWALFAFWGQPNCQINAPFYVMDHFSEKPVRELMDLWEEKFLPVFGDKRSVLRSLFCDSLEYRVDLEWTRTFAADFEKRKGYSIIPYLPALGNENVYDADDGSASSRNFGTYPTTNYCGYTFSDRSLAHKVNWDYFEMLTHLFCKNHVDYMQKRAEKLGLDIRYQVSYGKTMEAECAALYPGIPETEGLAGPLLDHYRVMGAAVHLDRKPLYSFELAAEAWNSYGQTHEDILWWMKRAFACGINAQVLHGGHYCGYYDGEGNENGLCPGVNWPGYEGFTRRTWTNAWNRTLDKKNSKITWDYFARCNFLLRNPHKVDIAVYRNDYLNRAHQRCDGDAYLKDVNWLNSNGYTYEFVTPELLKHPNAVVKNGVLDCDGAAYKCLIVDNEAYMSYVAAEKIRELALGGLPVIFIGRIPDKVVYQSEQQTDAALWTLLKQMPHQLVGGTRVLHTVLKQLNILPDMLPDKPVTLYPVHLKIDGADFYYVYNGAWWNDGDPETKYPAMNKEKVMHPVDAEVSFLGEGELYELDGFSGGCVKLESRTEHGRTIAKLHFARDEAKIFALLTPEQAAAFGIDGQMQRKLPVKREVELSDWTLQINEILPPKDKIGTIYESVWQKKEPIRLTKLIPWNEISEDLYKTSGIGIYTTEFELEELPEQAVLHLQHVVDTYSVRLNGKELFVGDPVLRETELTSALVAGKNHLEIEVASTMQNAASFDFLYAEGKKTTTQGCGIIGRAYIAIH